MSKKLIWNTIYPGGEDVEARTEFGTYTISFDSPTAGGAANLWLAGAGVDDFSVWGKRSEAMQVAQLNYDARRAGQ